MHACTGVIADSGRGCTPKQKQEPAASGFVLMRVILVLMRAINLNHKVRFTIGPKSLPVTVFWTFPCMAALLLEFWTPKALPPPRPSRNPKKKKK